jgi:hypothetical protein
MLERYLEILTGASFSLVGFFLVFISRKKCISTICSLPKKDSVNKDVVGFMIGILLFIFGLLIIFV